MLEYEEPFMARNLANGTFATRQNLAAKRKRAHGQVVAEGAELAALVLEVVDELRVLAVLAAEDLLELKDGRVDGDAAVKLKDAGDGLEDLVAEEHLVRQVVLGALLRDVGIQCRQSTE
jgi:hypothetical protein